MRIFQCFAAVIFIFLAFDGTAACSCAPPRAPCNYYGDASAIFVGRAVGSAQRKTVIDENGEKITFDVGTIRFLVLENFKGASGYEVEISSGTGGGDCGYCVPVKGWQDAVHTYLHAHTASVFRR
jgi:hypothetical protein